MGGTGSQRADQPFSPATLGFSGGRGQGASAGRCVTSAVRPPDPQPGSGTGLRLHVLEDPVRLVRLKVDYTPIEQTLADTLATYAHPPPGG
jgi:hypothetical protein